MATLIATSSPPITVYASPSVASKPSYSTPSLPPNENSVSTSAPFQERQSLRPAKNIEAFNSLLPPPVEFVEGSSTGSFGLTGVEGKYEPINASPKANGISELNGRPKQQTQVTPKKQLDEPSDARQSLYNRPIDITWPGGVLHGTGLFNLGNTCFLNSTLQCLLHTAPLIRVLHAHSKSEPCRVKDRNFCMSCAMREVMEDSLFRKRGAFSPSPITKNLHLIAKHLRRGRQEDSHEFLRYAIDSLQKSCLAGHSPKLDHKTAETSWVHKIFGGRLRSRVTCSQCGHNSDTFDSILDLSVDIYNISGLKEALKKFTAIDYLKGADKYKCEKCKRPVNAEKRFTIHEAPTVLTVHLKRFTPMGRKLAHPIRYDERLNLQPAMSEGQFGPTYSLYGVISHAGSGPNSGHYYAHVKGSNGSWYEMNDESVEGIRNAPTNLKNAYILFYIREKGQSLEAAVNNTTSVPHTVGTVPGASKKRKIAESSDEDDPSENERVVKPFIGPAIPSHLLSPSGQPKNTNTSKSGLQANIQKKKVEIARQNKKVQQAIRSPLKQLVDYEDEEEEKGEIIERLPAPGMTPNSEIMHENMRNDESSPAPPPTSSPLSTPTPSPVVATAPNTSLTTPAKSDVSRFKESFETDMNTESVTASNTSLPLSHRLPNGTPNKLRKSPQHKGFGASNPYNRARVASSMNNIREDRELQQLKVQKNVYSRKKKSLF